MRSVGVKVPVETYLKTAYRPDCEYVDGEIVERNVGEYEHGRLQILLAAFFLRLERKLGLRVVPEQRVQVKAQRFRVPDVCVFKPETPRESILTKPPLICVEVLSPEDRMKQVQERVKDYLDFGVRHVWILNPYTRKAFVCTPSGVEEVEGGVIRIDDPQIEVPIGEIFSQLAE